MKITCQLCLGAGSITYPHHSGDPQLETERTCVTCDGTGEAETSQEAVEELIQFVHDCVRMNLLTNGMERRAERVLLSLMGSR